MLGGVKAGLSMKESTQSFQQTQVVIVVADQVAGHGQTLDEYEAFKAILESENAFETAAEKLFYDESGFEDEAVREDVEEIHRFENMFDRNELKDDGK